MSSKGDVRLSIMTQNLMKNMDTNMDLTAFLEGYTKNPHHVLGLHDTPEGGKVVRIYRPGASEVFIEASQVIVACKKVHDAGVFEYIVPANTTAKDYRIYHQNGLLAHDPYAFMPTFGELDQYLFNRGVHYKLFEVMGAHPISHQGVQGIKFCVWAPSAKKLSLIGDFNYWNGATNPMRMIGSSGVWELFVPGLKEGDLYKFEMINAQGEMKIKSDPFAFSSELRPSTASVVFDLNQFNWSDQEWIVKRAAQKEQQIPMNIYEVHLGSWKKGENEEFLNYRQLAHELVSYCQEMSYTHIELMPIAEHPLDESWGYQVTGFFAVTSRYGTPRDFQYFVDYCHKHDIGVILDWVPAHFPTDDFSLGRFDGTGLYEHVDDRQGFHPHWNTFIFNYGRREVANFLIANALFWFSQMHIDGLRVDAVASMLYLDYGREEGQWIPNAYGGKENLDAIEMIKHLNSVVHAKYPGVLMIAEESTSFSGVSRSVEYDGLGFDMKWNMGWMNDTLRYFQKDPIYRGYHHNDLTFGLIYAFSEKFMLVLSHDEVVHGKRSLLSKMPGDMWQQFANLRLLYSYMMCQPGKKLMFMGGEIGQWNEWNCKSSIEWNLLDFPTHQGIHKMVKDINYLYKEHRELWGLDSDYHTFEWVDFSDRHNSVISYLRKSESKKLLCIHNFTPNYHAEYVVHLKEPTQSICEIFNSDSEFYGGSGKVNSSIKMLENQYGEGNAVSLSLAPLATMIFELS